jgi:hypothetical protein
MLGNPKVCVDTMLTLQKLLLECNPFVPLMKQTYETLVRNEDKATNISIL